MNLLALDQAGWLLLLPLAALPWLVRPADVHRFSWIGLLPRDRLGEWVQRLQKSCATMAIMAILAGLAGPHRTATAVDRIGRGSEIALLLDRSRSMDQPFVETRRTINPYYQEKQQDILGSGGDTQSKGSIARQVLADFAAGRPHDLVAYTLFSSFPIPVLPFTQNHAMLMAAISAGDAGKGLADTDIGAALLFAAQQWRDRPWRGSRTIVLVSDGGAQLDPEMRQRLAYELHRNRIGINFLYIRSYNSHGLKDQVPEAEVDEIPELSLHKFLGGIGISYRAYEAASGADLRRAVADIGERESTPIVYRERLPRQDYAAQCYLVACLATLAWFLTLLPEWIARSWPRPRS